MYNEFCELVGSSNLIMFMQRQIYMASQTFYLIMRSQHTRREQSGCCLVSKIFWLLCPSLGSADPGASYLSPAEMKVHKMIELTELIGCRGLQSIKQIILAQHKDRKKGKTATLALFKGNPRNLSNTCRVSWNAGQVSSPNISA